MASSGNPYAEHRTDTISTRVTEEEYKELEAIAQAKGVRMSEWVREVLLNQRGSADGEDVILAELMALRVIVINIVSAQAQGQAMTREKITDLIRAADKERFRHANEKWIEVANHYMGQSPRTIHGKSKGNGTR
jgi:hypothetical protein